MANTSFDIFKSKDSELISALVKIASMNKIAPPHQIVLQLAQSGGKSVTISTEEVESHPDIQPLLLAESALFKHITLKNSNDSVTLQIQRQEGYDKATISYHDNLGLSQIGPFLTAAHKQLRSYDRTENLDNVLGREMAEFYRKREETLLRLEQLSERLIRQNEEYRQKVDRETADLRANIQREYDSTKEGLQSSFSKKDEEVKLRETKLEERTRELDDRSSRHARRQIRMDLHQKLEQKEKAFKLTRGTSLKRLPIHFLFILLIAIPGSIFLRSAWTLAIGDTFQSNYELIWHIVHTTLSAIACAAAVIFYIRWNDHWFRQHADEEFRLKRLELDIDRASWVVEMAQEWREGKGSEIPPELISQLTRNLFIDPNDNRLVKHPTEDLASALMRAASSLTLKIPGYGEVVLDRKSLKNFKKATSDES